MRLRRTIPVLLLAAAGVLAPACAAFAGALPGSVAPVLWVGPFSTLANCQTSYNNPGRGIVVLEQCEYHSDGVNENGVVGYYYLIGNPAVPR
jgi:hypothetical protein